MARTRVEEVEPIGKFVPEKFAPDEDPRGADEALTTLADSWRHSIKRHMGIWRDLKVWRRKTEVDEQVGQIVVTGRERSVRTPVNAAVLEIMHEIESGESGMGWENLEEIARRSGAVPSAR